MQQIILSEYSFSIFDSRNWTFYTKELFPLVREHSWAICDSIDIMASCLDDIFKKFYDLGTLPMNYDEIRSLKSKNRDNFFFLIIDSWIEIYFSLWYISLVENDNQVQLFVIDAIFPLFYNPNINLYFIFLLLLIHLTKWHYDFSMAGYTSRTGMSVFYQFIVYDFLTLVLNKYETSEEAICMVVLWPWCFLLVFTHVFLIDNNEIIFIFVEWGLPVVYGFLLLIEHLWNFGSHFFIYLNGGRGRRSFLLTVIEDILTFFIVIIRVSLQVVRGLLCGFFHNFFREVTDTLTNNFHMYTFYSDWSIPFFRSSYFFVDFIDMCGRWYFIGFGLLFVYAILFLQLLFLIIAVWLFCRCWFISSSHISEHSVQSDYLWNKKRSLYDHRRDIYLGKVHIDDNDHKDFDNKYAEILSRAYCHKFLICLKRENF